MSSEQLVGVSFLRVGPKGEERPAVMIGGEVLDVSDLIDDYTPRFWIESQIDILRQALDRPDRNTLPRVDLSQTRIGPPVPPPSKLVCVGLNYAEHVRESGAEMPDEPVLFMKAPNTVVGPNDDLLIPPGSKKTDYEVELAVVIGSTCRYLPDEAAAQRAIAGYAISNDVSEREYQLERGGQWVKGKSCETFNPLGPLLVPSDELDGAPVFDLELRVNGDIRQAASTSDLIFSVPALIRYISQFMVLEPGDIINTGTPLGVGLGMSPQRYLAPDDLIEVSITGLGSQRTRCRSARMT